MKKTMFGVVASVGAVLSAQSQGSFFLDNSGILPGLAADRSGNWYDGTFGMEVWELNSQIVPAGINLSAAPGAGVLGYDAMVAAGFVKDRTFAGRTTAGPGAFVFGEVDMAGATPAGRPGQQLVDQGLRGQGGRCEWPRKHNVRLLPHQPNSIPAPVRRDQFHCQHAVRPRLPGIPGRLLGRLCPDLVLSDREAPSCQCTNTFLGHFGNADWFQDDNTWADADSSYFYYAWSDGSRTWTNVIGGTNYTMRPDADVKLAKIRR